MTARKIEVLPSNGRRFKHDDESEFWSNLWGLNEFKTLDNAKMWQLIGACVAEMFGTAILVGLGCSGLIKGFPGGHADPSLFDIILTFGCAISLVVTVFGHISGSHVNPAVSLSAVIFGHLSIPKCFLYIVSQCLGAVLGIASVKVISPTSCTAQDFCVTLPNPELNVSQALLAEAFMTTILVWVVNAAWDRRCQDKHDSLPVKFGLAIVALALPGAKYSGGSMNPARSFGPALVAGNFTSHWVYWVGPMGGAIVASAIYKTFLAEMDPPQPVRVRVSDHDEEHPL